MDIATIIMRQEAIIRELQHAEALPPEEYERQGWLNTGKLKDLATEYAQLDVQRKLYQFSLVSMRRNTSCN